MFSQTELVGFIFPTIVNKTIDKTIVNDSRENELGLCFGRGSECPGRIQKLVGVKFCRGHQNFTLTLSVVSY